MQSTTSHLALASSNKTTESFFISAKPDLEMTIFEAVRVGCLLRTIDAEPMPGSKYGEQTPESSSTVVVELPKYSTDGLDKTFGEVVRGGVLTAVSAPRPAAKPVVENNLKAQQSAAPTDVQSDPPTSDILGALNATIREAIRAGCLVGISLPKPFSQAAIELEDSVSKATQATVSSSPNTNSGLSETIIQAVRMGCVENRLSDTQTSTPQTAINNGVTATSVDAICDDPLSENYFATACKQVTPSHPSKHHQPWRRSPINQKRSLRARN